MNKKLWDHKIEKLKRPGMDIPEPPNSRHNQPPPSPRGIPSESPPRQRRQRRNRTSTPIRDALEILGLQPGVTEREVKIKFRQLSQTYHPDKHQPEKTGITNEEATELFQQMNNAQELVIEHLRANPPT